MNELNKSGGVGRCNGAVTPLPLRSGRASDAAGSAGPYFLNRVLWHGPGTDTAVRYRLLPTASGSLARLRSPSGSRSCGLLFPFVQLPMPTSTANVGQHDEQYGCHAESRADARAILGGTAPVRHRSRQRDLERPTECRGGAAVRSVLAFDADLPRAACMPSTGSASCPRPYPAFDIQRIPGTSYVAPHPACHAGLRCLPVAGSVSQYSRYHPALRFESVPQPLLAAGAPGSTTSRVQGIEQRLGRSRSPSPSSSTRPPGGVIIEVRPSWGRAVPDLAVTSSAEVLFLDRPGKSRAWVAHFSVRVAVPVLRVAASAFGRAYVSPVCRFRPMLPSRLTTSTCSSTFMAVLSDAKVA